MKNTLLVCVLFLTTSICFAGSEEAFRQILSLEGTWEGTYEGQTIRLIYQPISEKAAMMEQMVWVPDGSNMTTIYHPQGDQLMATHYCKAKNQPRLVTSPQADSNTLNFEFLDGAKPGQKYLSGLGLRFVNENQLEQTVRFEGNPTVITVLYTRKTQ
jgi:hypothetical protein